MAGLSCADTTLSVTMCGAVSTCQTLFCELDIDFHIWIINCPPKSGHSHYWRFMDMETKAQRGKLICPKSVSYQWRQDVNPDQVAGPAFLRITITTQGLVLVFRLV